MKILQIIVGIGLIIWSIYIFIDMIRRNKNLEKTLKDDKYGNFK